MAEKTFYIASAECREVKAFDGKILTQDGTVIWLGMSEGYASCGRGKGSAKRFESPDDIHAKKWDGMPWWYRLKEGSLKIYKVVETKTCSLEETPWISQ